MRIHLSLIFLALVGSGIGRVASAEEPSEVSGGTSPRHFQKWVPVDLAEPDADDLATSGMAEETSPARLPKVEQCSHTTGTIVGDLSDYGAASTVYGDPRERGMRLRCFDIAYVSTDLLFLSRDVGKFTLIGTDGGGTQVFRETLSHGFEPGLRINLGLRLWGNGFIEARHALATGWEARGSYQPLPGNPGAIAAQGAFSGQYHSTEINLVAEDPVRDEFQFLLGLRVIEQGDSFNATLTSQTPSLSESYTGSADNSMFGMQAGFRTGWFYRRSVWSLSIIGGVLNNQISQRGPRFASALVLDGTPDPQFSVDEEKVSLFADLEASVAYPILPSTFVRIGAQGVFMGNAVTIADQEGSPADPGAISFYGGFVGLEYLH